MLKADIAKIYKIDNFFNSIIITGIITYIFMYLVLGFCAQPAADDYCFINKLAKDGFIPSQISWYTGWTGRYASTALVSIFLLAFDLIQSFWLLPLFLIVTTCAAFSFFVYSLSQGHLTGRQALFGGLILTALYLSGVPSTSEGFYWLAGGITYQGGNNLYLLLLAVLTREHACSGSRKTIYITCLLVLLIAGMNETIMFLQSLTLALASCNTFVKGSKERFKLLALFILSLVGAAIVIAAPGNAVRSGFFPLAHNLPFSVQQSVKYAYANLVLWTRSFPLWMATFIWIPLVSAATSRGYKTVKAGFLNISTLTVSWLLLLTLLYFPAFWSMGSPPPPRTLSIAYLIFIIGWFLSMTLIGVSLTFQSVNFSSSYFRSIGAAFVCSLFLAGNGAAAFRDMDTSFNYSAQFKERYEIIKLQKLKGQFDIKVPVLQQNPTTIFVTADSTCLSNTSEV